MSAYPIESLEFLPRKVCFIERLSIQNQLRTTRIGNSLRRQFLLCMVNHNCIIDSHFRRAHEHSCLIFHPYHHFQRKFPRTIKLHIKTYLLRKTTFLGVQASECSKNKTKQNRKNKINSKSNRQTRCGHAVHSTCYLEVSTAR